jgi:CheY-like chemotaxis protein
MILDVFEGGLATAGYAVLKAASGREGLRLFKENHVDMILCDLGMPRMDGWEVAEAIRDFCEELGLVKPPLILVTAWAEQIYGDERISKLEIDAVLGKPVSIDALLQTVAGEIAKRRRDSAGA